MLSKNAAKKITSLSQKKYRQREGLFVAEGVKVINELLDSHLELSELFVEGNTAFAKALKENSTVSFIEVTKQELSKVTFLKRPQSAIAIFQIPKIELPKNTGLTLALDDVRDPGNLGTIIRLCDWFGIEQLICSETTVDCYNPKVVQATMGSLTRVTIQYTNLEEFIKKDARPVYGTFMEGTNIYKESLPDEGIIVMGNEANGISTVIEQLINKRIAIPRFGKQKEAESLNVAMAASICLSEFRRKI